MLKLLVIFLSSMSLFATIPYEESIILQSRYAGMFSIFQDVLSLTQLYEKGRFNGASVDFASTGIFYDDCEGYNWWNYYFEPISLGNINVNSKIYNNLESWRIEFCNNREYNNYLINKYIHLKPYLKEKIEFLQKILFQNHQILGIHYRGGDKVRLGTMEAVRVPYEEVEIATREFLRNWKDKSYKIFIATDETDFINYMLTQFPGRVIYYEPSHYLTKRNFERGECAIIDAILLSKTDFLIRTNSNLSLCSLFFNTSLQHLDLSVGLWHPVKKMRMVLDEVYTPDTFQHKFLDRTMEYFLLNNGEHILVLGDSYFNNLFYSLLRETPSKITHHSWTEPLENKDLISLDLLYIAPADQVIDPTEKAELLLVQMMTISNQNCLNKNGLIVVDDQELSSFQALAMPYLLSNGFDFFEGNSCIFQKK